MSILLTPAIFLGSAKSFTYVAEANSTLNTGNITIPATAAVGDLAVLFDSNYGGGSSGGNVRRVPAGFTHLANTGATGGEGSAAVSSYKILVGGDPGATVAGTSNTGGITHNRVMAVFRPVGITSVVASTWNAQSIAGNPTLQTVSASGVAAPLIVFGCTVADGSSMTFTTATPAFDDTIECTGTDMLLGYKIYNAAGTPANHSIDVGDIGDVCHLHSGYIRAA